MTDSKPQTQSETRNGKIGNWTSGIVGIAWIALMIWSMFGSHGHSLLIDIVSLALFLCFVVDTYWSYRKSLPADKLLRRQQINAAYVALIVYSIALCYVYAIQYHAHMAHDKAAIMLFTWFSNTYLLCGFVQISWAGRFGKAKSKDADIS